MIGSKSHFDRLQIALAAASPVVRAANIALRTTVRDVAAS